MIPFDRIEPNPRVCNAKPVIKRTRIPVSVILEQIAEGESSEAVLAGYPELKKMTSKLLCIMRGHPWNTQRLEPLAPEPLKLYLDQMFRVDVAQALRREGYDVVRIPCFK